MFLSILYSLQLVNWIIYSYNINKNRNQFNHSNVCIIKENTKPSQDDYVSLNELLIPMSLSLMLSLVHSQIVSTSSTNSTATEKQKKTLIQSVHRKKRERKKRKKSMRNRLVLNATNDTKATKILTDGLSDNECKSSLNDQQTSAKTAEKLCSQLVVENQKSFSGSDSNCSPPLLRKRCVNWDSPIKSHVNLTSNGNSVNGNGDRNNTVSFGAEDDGFESLNGKSSSGEEMSAINNENPVVSVEKTRENESFKVNEQPTVNTTESFENINVKIDGLNEISENVNLYFLKIYVFTLPPNFKKIFLSV